MASEKKASALAHYKEGVGLRATERLVGGSHHAVMHWVLEEVEGRALALAKPEEVEFVEADELWACVGQRKRPTGCGGLWRARAHTTEMPFTVSAGQAEVFFVVMTGILE